MRDRLAQTPSIDRALLPADRLSQASVLEQLDHVRSSRLVAEGLGHGARQLHGGWFDVERANLHEWRQPELRFVRLDLDEPRL